MKKGAMLIATVMVLGISLVAYAGGAQKVYFEQTTACVGVDDGVHANAEGWVIINLTPTGATEVVIQIQIRDAADHWSYAVYSGGDLLGSFTTNKKGHGHFHCNLPEDTLGEYINIWNHVKNGPDLPAAAKLLFAEVPVDGDGDEDGDGDGDEDGDEEDDDDEGGSEGNRFHWLV